MTTHSALLPGSTVNLFTVEHATSLLTTHLGLEDDIRSEGTNDNCKGKDNAEAFISDADFALRIQAEDLVNAVQIVEDAQFARELEEGFQANHLYLVMNPPSAAHRREIALSLLKRSGLSTLSDGQQIKASTSSVSLGSRLRTSTCEADPDTSQNVERNRCVVCDDFLGNDEPFLQAPCDHYYCRECIAGLVSACTSDEVLYPPKCCNLPIPNDTTMPFLSDTLRSDYFSKQREFAVPITQRIYCPIPDCPAFIASSESVSGDVTCYRCRATVCSMCKQIAHTGDCSNDPGILQVRVLARLLRWQTCPNCHAIIEHSGGCNHMTCRCAFQFCYYCGRRWRTCNC